MIYIYVKIHKLTGLKYFGKTTKDSYETYLGSGLVWKRHLKKYGKDIKTFLIKTFEETEVENCTNFCVKFSVDNRIVESEYWANLRIENGTDGAPVGHKGSNPSKESRERTSKIAKKRWENSDFKMKVSESQKTSWNEERKTKHSLKLTGRKRPDQTARLSGSALPEDHPFKQKGVVKTKEHRQKIKDALENKPKTLNHRVALAWSRLKNKEKFKNYLHFMDLCFNMKSDGYNLSEIADKLNVSWNSVKKAIVINNEYLLSEK
jgi:hypothetical protein